MSTIKDIARLANVSIGTVDRVLHQRGRVSAETENLILRLLKETGYRPNIFAKHLRLGRTFTFGVVMPKPSQDGLYWSLPTAGVAQAQRELEGQRVAVRHYYYDKNSVASVVRVRRAVLQASLDGLLIAPVLSKVFEGFLAEIPPALPYVLFDSFIPQSGLLAYIGQDAYQSGVLSARLMSLLIPPSARVAVLRILPEDYHIDERVRGFVDAFGRKRGLDIDVFEIDPYREEKARSRMFAGIVGRSGPMGVFVTNSSTHQIAAYVQARDLGGRIRIVGYDLVEKNARLLREGVIDFLISQRPERQGYLGIQTLYRHVVLREPVDPTIMMPLDIVARENIDQYRA